MARTRAASSELATLLSGRGHQVFAAPAAKAALAPLADERPDDALVALDVPMIDGCELVWLARTIDPPLPTPQAQDRRRAVPPRGQQSPRRPSLTARGRPFTQR